MRPKETVFDEFESIKFECFPSPKEDLKTLSDALKALSEPGLSMAEIQRQRRVIKAAKASQRLIHAYVRYLKFRVAFLEQQLSEAERS
jgi:hypothetical protein